MNNNELQFTFAIVPESKIYFSKFRQVFWLVFFLIAFPSFNRQWRVVQKVFYKTYSCGYSSGISPDSLFIAHSR